MNKRVVGFFLMIVSILLVLMIQINFTGYSISLSYFEIPLIHLIIVSFFIFSLILIFSGESLDAIIIPTQASEKRTREKTDIALKYRNKYGAKLLIASGGETPALSRHYKNGAQIIYARLRQNDVRPIDIKIDGRSRNNIENILFSLEKLRGIKVEKIGIVSYPGHLDRFDEIIDHGKKEGVIDPKIKFYRIETDENLIERLYEMPARYITRKQMGRGIKNAKIPEGWIKSLANYVMKIFS